MKLVYDPGAASPADPSPHAAAGRWLARLRADDRTLADEHAFRQWLARDPANAAHFERVSAVWDYGGGVAPVRSRADAYPPMLARRQVLAGIGALVAIGGVSLVGWDQAYAGTYRTAVGEQRRLTLDDGSRLTLDTDTALRMRFAGGERRLSLARGRVAIDVAADQRPFRIDAGPHGFTASTGSFDVRRDGDALVAITAVTGQLGLMEGGRARRLARGERARFAARAPARLDRPDLDDTLAWQSGRAAFHDDPLEAVAAEMNRYSETKLVIADARVAALRVSGVYRVGDNVALGRSLARLLDLNVRVSDHAVALAAIA